MYLTITSYVSGCEQKIASMSKSKKKKKQPERTNQLSEPDSNMTQMLELSGREFKITIIKSVVGSDGKSRKHERTDG